MGPLNGKQRPQVHVPITPENVTEPRCGGPVSGLDGLQRVPVVVGAELEEVVGRSQSLSLLDN